jgi:hypothetical protein
VVVCVLSEDLILNTRSYFQSFYRSSHARNRDMEWSLFRSSLHVVYFYVRTLGLY